MSQSWLAQSVSSAFLEAFRRCDPLSDSSNASKYMMAFPAIVCAAFSAEVGLKTMLARIGRAAKGHDLRALYLKLPGEVKYAVFEATGLSMEEFAAQLAHSRLAFSEWRYIYEENREMSINVNFLGKFASAVELVSLAQKSAA